MTTTEIEDLKRETALSLLAAPDKTAPLDDVKTRLCAAREKRDDLFAQRRAFTADLEKAAEEAEVAAQRVRLRLDTADTITGPREAAANLRQLLAGIEVEIETIGREIAVDEVRLEFTEALEVAAAPARAADQAAREFYAKREALAAHMETELRALAEIQGRVFKSQTEFSTSARAFAEKFPPIVPPDHPARSAAPQKAKLTVSAEILVEALADRVPLQNVQRVLTGYNVIGLASNTVITTGYGHHNTLSGTVYRVLGEFLTPSAPIS